MALTGKIEKYKEGDTEKEKLIIEFTNGTYEQLKEIQKYLLEEGITSVKDKGLEETIGFAIALLETIRENKKKAKT